MTTTSPVWSMHVPFGKLAYAALFVAILPASLAVWAHRLDLLTELPALQSSVVGGLLVLAGMLILGLGMAALWIHGQGLPMSPYPPKRRVGRGIYHLTAHPIYLGAIMMSGGSALAAGSAGGFWIVTPVVALAAAAYVLGYERDATLQRYGPPASPPLLSLPPALDASPTAWDRLAVYLLVFLPWLVLYVGVERLGVPPGAVVGYLPGEAELPVWPATEAVYALGYLFTAAVPLVARRQRVLREFAVRGLVATGVAVLTYLLLPIIAPAKPFEAGGVWGTMLRAERAHDQPITAFPAFHAIWAILAASLYSRTWARWRSLWWGLAIAISASCLTTGMHALVDVIAAWVIGAALLHMGRLWEIVRRAAESLAGSWREVRVGPIRLLSHGIYAALGVWVGSLTILALVGMANLPGLLLVGTCAIVSAGVWGQILEGSPAMLRPYGYYGSVLGIIGGTVLASALGADFWLIFAAFAAAGPFVQAAGRLRCLAQGCCHGRAAGPALGIRYTHPRTRVARLSTLAGVPLHPTPVYSIGANLVIGPVLLRLWMVRAPLTLVAGMYLLLSGLARFVEEHYRGEPQTVRYGGLPVYQWLAIVSVAAGAALTALGGPAAPTPAGLRAESLVPATLFAIAGYFAYGADLPTSNRRFSRLV
jgi:protein-S-isoprenylcysteine O-methyltransferase Ste14